MIRRRSAALLATVNAADYISNDNLTAAMRFMDQVERTFKDLEVMPRIGRPYETDNPRLQGLRVHPVKGFLRYLIFYFPIEDGIEVLPVVHSARNIQAA